MSLIKYKPKLLNTPDDERGRTKFVLNNLIDGVNLLTKLNIIFHLQILEIIICFI